MPGVTYKNDTSSIYMRLQKQFQTASFSSYFTDVLVPTPTDWSKVCLPRFILHDV